MSKDGARTALITSAMFVAGIRMWLQIRGKTTSSFQEWAVGWGATFFVLALLSEAMPTAAGGLSLVIAFSDFLENGVTLTTDIEKVVKGKLSGNVLSDGPFANEGQGGNETVVQPASPKNAGSLSHRYIPMPAPFPSSTKG